MTRKRRRARPSIYPNDQGCKRGERDLPTTTNPPYGPRVKSVWRVFYYCFTRKRGPAEGTIHL